MPEQAYAPGMRVLFRDAEWLVTRVEYSDHAHKNHAVHCIGADDLVRGHEVRLASMQRIKGLEFRAMAMACSDPKDALNHLENATLKDKCERYVAATRARERLFVSLAKT